VSYHRRMWRALVLLAILGCGQSDQAQGARKEDRDRPAEAPALLTLDVVRAGKHTTWGPPAFARTAKMQGTASSGEARDTWSLRELAAANAGAGARVLSVTGKDGVRPIDPTAWADATKVPVLHATRRGALKFRWASPAGAWGPAIASDVTAIEIAP